MLTISYARSMQRQARSASSVVSSTSGGTRKSAAAPGPVSPRAVIASVFSSSCYLPRISFQHPLASRSDTVHHPDTCAPGCMSSIHRDSLCSSFASAIPFTLRDVPTSTTSPAASRSAREESLRGSYAWSAAHPAPADLSACSRNPESLSALSSSWNLHIALSHHDWLLSRKSYHRRDEEYNRKAGAKSANVSGLRVSSPWQRDAL